MNVARRVDARSWLVGPAVGVLLLVFVYPIFWLLLRSIDSPSWGLQNFDRVLGQSLFIHTLWNTAVISGMTAVICLALGYPMAYVIAHAKPGARRVLLYVVLVPFWSSVLVRSFAWMVILQRNGLINRVLLDLGLVHTPLTLIYNRIGVLIGMVQILLPFMILPLYSVLIRIDATYTQAAASLGATPVRNFLWVYLPLSVPGVVTGSVLVFAIALGYYITPALLGGPHDLMIAQLIEQEVANFGSWGLAGALGVVLLGCTSVVFIVVHRTLVDNR